MRLIDADALKTELSKCGFDATGTARLMQADTVLATLDAASTVCCERCRFIKLRGGGRVSAPQPLDELRDSILSLRPSALWSGPRVDSVKDTIDRVVLIFDAFEAAHPGLVDLTGWTEVSEGRRPDMSSGQLIDWVYAKRPACAAKGEGT